MNTLIICNSKHQGNTRKIAEVMADMLDAEILETPDVHVEMVRRFDLVGFGSGIYGGRHDEKLLSLVDKLPFGDGERVFIFSTSWAGEKKAGEQHKALRERLVYKGYEIAGELSVKGLAKLGFLKMNKHHPDAMDLEAVRKFALGLRR